jgi:hypothetical protein
MSGRRKSLRLVGLSFAAASALAAPRAPVSAGPPHGVRLTRIGTYTTGVFDKGAAEIVAHDPATQRLFVVNAKAATIDVLDIGDPTAPKNVHTIDVTPFGAVANSVAAHGGLVAVAVEAAVRQQPGKVVFFDARSFAVRGAVDVGAGPDMLTFTPNGRFVLVANEGEPNADYSVDPEGSVSVVEVPCHGAAPRARVAGFSRWNARPLERGIRIFGKNAPTVAQDLEPEYIAISKDSRTAWVTLQENNAMAVVDIPSATVLALRALGEKDHSLPGQGLDPSDADGANAIAPWPVRGLYMPDAIASFEHQGQSYLVLANEGDAREYTGFAEAKRVKSLALDPLAFPNGSALKTDAQLGRLQVSTASGDVDGDGDFDALYAFGTRSISIRRPDGSLVWDSGEELERITLEALPDRFNANHTANARDARSDDKGPEPEGVTIGRAFGMTLAFVGLERISGVVTYDVTNPFAPRALDYVNTRDFTKNPETETAVAGDLGPEGLHFIKAEESPNGKPLLVVGNEVSGSTAIYEIAKVD